QTPGPAGAGTLERTGDLSAQMVEGIDRFLMKKIAASRKSRDEAGEILKGNDWPAKEKLRQEFRRIIGAVDPLAVPIEMELRGTAAKPSLIAQRPGYAIHRVAWPALEGVHGEGLLLQPKGTPRGAVICLPDADWSPEAIAGLVPGVERDHQFARTLAEGGWQTLVMTLVDRDVKHSGNPVIGRKTRQPHREWIYRQAYELGRHVIGYEVRKIEAAVDWLARDRGAAKRPIAVVGYGEGGLLALYAAALEPRIDGAFVSGYFGARERVWEEPIYRNVFGQLKRLGDAEIFGLIAPRLLAIEAASLHGKGRPAQVHAPGLTPGKIADPPAADVATEFERARRSIGSGEAESENPMSFANAGGAGPGIRSSLAAFAARLGPGLGPASIEANTAGSGPKLDLPAEIAARQARTVRELIDFTQKRLRDSERVRRETFWNPLPPRKAETWTAQVAAQRKKFRDDVIGSIKDPKAPPNPKARKLRETDKTVSYEVTLDVWEDVYAWGYLTLPKDLKEGERRPVVVCQHGLEGV
ncbi:MAG TPA: dienelactone hydrolase family protein, partial [Planctomycetia bacterium]|nr:dienelactone hydrolase family protein [Planctomycetia bacterium]